MKTSDFENLRNLKCNMEQRVEIKGRLATHLLRLAR